DPLMARYRWASFGFRVSNCQRATKKAKLRSSVQES
ncbi:hypothetical protein CCACVL1_24510, partial [Corchorus capsularis]